MYIKFIDGEVMKEKKQIDVNNTFFYYDTLTKKYGMVTYLDGEVISLYERWGKMNEELREVVRKFDIRNTIEGNTILFNT